MLSSETLLLCRQVLSAQQLSAGAADFAEVSTLVIQALAELDEAIAAQEAI